MRVKRARDSTESPALLFLFCGYGHQVFLGAAVVFHDGEDNLVGISSHLKTILKVDVPHLYKLRKISRARLSLPLFLGTAAGQWKA